MILYNALLTPVLTKQYCMLTRAKTEYRSGEKRYDNASQTELCLTMDCAPTLFFFYQNLLLFKFGNDTQINMHSMIQMIFTVVRHWLKFKSK